MRLATSLRAYDRRKQEARLDDLWGRIIKARAGYRCEDCGSKRASNAAHIISRGRKATRWNLDNGVCLCAGHHMNFHRHPYLFYTWVDVHRGRNTVDRLRMLSQGRRPDLEMIAVQLKIAAREYGVTP